MIRMFISRFKAARAISGLTYISILILTIYFQFKISREELGATQPSVVLTAE
jgi:hypothetical protein